MNPRLGEMMISELTQRYIALARKVEGLSHDSSQGEYLEALQGEIEAVRQEIHKKAGSSSNFYSKN